jgi:hypothetical protein
MDFSFDGVTKLLEKIPAVIALAITFGLAGFVFTGIDVATSRGFVQAGFIFCVAYVVLHFLAKFLHWAGNGIASRTATRAAQANAAREQDARGAEQRRQIADRLVALNEDQSTVLCEIKVRGAREFQAWRNDPILSDLHALRFILKDRYVGEREALWIVPRDVWELLDYPLTGEDRQRIVAQRPSWVVRYENWIRRRI